MSDLSGDQAQFAEALAALETRERELYAALAELDEARAALARAQDNEVLAVELADRVEARLAEARVALARVNAEIGRAYGLILEREGAVQIVPIDEAMRSRLDRLAEAEAHHREHHRREDEARVALAAEKEAHGKTRLLYDAALELAGDNDDAIGAERARVAALRTALEAIARMFCNEANVDENTGTCNCRGGCGPAIARAALAATPSTEGGA